MKLISLNIEVDKHYDTVIPFLKKERPDVVCLQEIPENDLDFFKKELGMNIAFRSFKYINYSYKYQINGTRQGVAIFARNIIDSGFFFYYGKEENILKPFNDYLSNINNQTNCVLLWADIKDDNGVLFKILNTHLPVTKEGTTTPLQLQAVNSLLLTLRSFPDFILCGDMNAPRGGKAFSCLAKKYKDNIPMKYKTSIDPNLHRTKGIMLMVDGLFTTPVYKASNVKLIDGVSDHMAIVADIENI